MKWLFQSEYQRHGDSYRDGNPHFSDHRISAKREGEHSGDDTGDAEIPLRARLQPGEGTETEREGEERKSQKDLARRSRKSGGKAAQKRRQGVGAKACGALALGLFPLSPASLEANEQTDRQGYGEPVKGVAHERTSPRVRFLP